MMPWVTFERDYNWMPEQFHGWWLQQFRAGMTSLVTREADRMARGTGAGRPATQQEIEDVRRR